MRTSNHVDDDDDDDDADNDDDDDDDGDADNDDDNDNLSCGRLAIDTNVTSDTPLIGL